MEMEMDLSYLKKILNIIIMIDCVAHCQGIWVICVQKIANKYIYEFKTHQREIKNLIICLNGYKLMFLILYISTQ